MKRYARCELSLISNDNGDYAGIKAEVFEKLDAELDYKVFGQKVFNNKFTDHPFPHKLVARVSYDMSLATMWANVMYVRAIYITDDLDNLLDKLFEDVS